MPALVLSSRRTPARCTCASDRGNKERGGDQRKNAGSVATGLASKQAVLDPNLKNRKGDLHGRLLL